MSLSSQELGTNEAPPASKDGGKSRVKKYPPKLLIEMFRKAAAFRNDAVKAGFTDNGGAIHSAERIMNLLGLCLSYPGLSHQNNLRLYQGAEFSDEAWELHAAGQKVLIEHVSPLRHLTQMAVEQVDKNICEDAFVEFVKSHYRLVLLSPAETVRLNKLNRSRVSSDRLSSAGIEVKTRP